MLHALLFIRTNEGSERKTRCFVAHRRLKGPRPSHARQVRFPPRGGPYAMVYFAYAFIRHCVTTLGRNPSIYLSMALQPFVKPWQLSQFLNPIHSR
jgi:hypothetical protein